MANDILASTKELLGVPAGVEEFDAALVSHINHVLYNLTELGVGDGAYVTTADEGSFDSFYAAGDDIYPTMQMYIFLKVKLLFDPPASSFVLASLESQIKELQWRLTDYTAVP